MLLLLMLSLLYRFRGILPLIISMMHLMEQIGRKLRRALQVLSQKTSLAHLTLIFADFSSYSTVPLIVAPHNDHMNATRNEASLSWKNRHSESETDV